MGESARAAPGGAKVTALHASGATALKAEPEAKLSPAEQLEYRIDPADARAHAKHAASEKRAEARAKGYEGEACGECGNFTLVRNGTCMKCDTCGSDDGVFVMEPSKTERDLADETWREALAAEREAFRRYLASDPETQWLEKQRWELKREQRVEAADVLAALTARRATAA